MPRVVFVCIDKFSTVPSHGCSDIVVVPWVCVFGINLIPAVIGTNNRVCVLPSKREMGYQSDCLPVREI